MSFSKKIIQWYRAEGRQLPWRNVDNPYFIWLSEIILQQTRIEQGMEYYFHFIYTYPTVADLASATEEQVLKSWQGLGYYSRARNLHSAAQYIVNYFNGEFPDNYKDICSLKGVGPYTAAAVASFAFKLPYPVIDGNVYRLITRLFGIYTPVPSNAAYKEIETLLKSLMDVEHPDLFNQALMDYGSMVCKPLNPDCVSCIFARECIALQKGKVEVLPVKMAPPKVKERFFYYFDVEWPMGSQRYTWVQCRMGKDIWQGLYEYPLVESDSEWDDKRLVDYAKRFGGDFFSMRPIELTCSAQFTHKLTHQTIKARFVHMVFDEEPCSNPLNSQSVPCVKLKTLPVSRLIDKYLSKK